MEAMPLPEAAVPKKSGPKGLPAKKGALAQKEDKVPNHNAEFSSNSYALAPGFERGRVFLDSCRE